jgi:hypothetical protein
VFGGAEVNELVDIVLNAGLAEDGIGHDAARNTEQRETVGAGGVVKMIGCLSAAAPRHILKSDSRISRNVFGEDRCQGFSAQVTHPSGTRTNDESNRLSLVKRRL